MWWVYERHKFRPSGRGTYIILALVVEIDWEVPVALHDSLRAQSSLQYSKYMNSSS